MAQQDQTNTAAPKGGNRAKRILLTLGVAVLAFGAWEGFQWYSFGRFHESSDDAYLQADLVTVLARDSGYIVAVPLAPNSPVRKGQVLAQIDPGDYQLALDTAQNTLASAQSAVTRIEAQITSGKAAIDQADAALAAAEATRDGAQKAYDRAANLKGSVAGNQSTIDSTRATALSAAAEVKSAAAALEQARAEVVVLEAQKAEQVLSVAAARTQVAQAERDLGFTEIRAPFDGVLTERQVEVGSYVATGSRIGTLVPMDAIYAEANFKETQIAGIRPGGKVTLTVDAWPDTVLQGTVESLTAGTGQVFSLLPASNATGNFTKVVQRVPVRIAIDPADRAKLPLRPGMSVVVEVDTRTGTDVPLVPAGPAAAPGANPADQGAATSQLGTTPARQEG